MYLPILQLVHYNTNTFNIVCKSLYKIINYYKTDQLNSINSVREY